MCLANLFLLAYQDRRDSLRGEIDAVTRRKAAAEHLGVLLTESEGDFRDLLDRIGSIARVWTSVSHPDIDVVS